MTDSAQRMRRLIDDLLAYSRVSRRRPELQPTDSEAVLRQSLESLHASVAESSAVITCDRLPTVMADQTRLLQLFQNLLANALKFCRQEAPRVHVSAEQQQNEWIFSVRDNGIGIDPQYSDQIFWIFERLHSRHEYPGTGIGLALCKRIVEQHQGRIWVESKAGEGATFYFTLPAKEPSPAPAGEP